MKKSLSSFVVACAASVACAAVSVQDISIQQRWPWNGMVDIDYTLVCDQENADIYVYPVAFDGDRNISIAPRTLTGAGASAPVKAGTHRMTWDMSTDEPGLHSANFTMKIHAFTGAAPYLVVDLSSGADSTHYEFRYSNTPPDLTQNTCRTTELWLRLILPGTFMMGSPSTELGRGTNETLHQVTLTKPFYMGVFEVTQKQWELVMGSNPSYYKYSVSPVENVSYNMIRGSVSGILWPKSNQVDSTSFMGKIRNRTGLTFDLPTEAQWEYACRAGTSTALNNGKNLTNVSSCLNTNEVGRYSSNRSDGKGGWVYHTKVGSYQPNIWGLYDMHGNVYEWCLDRWTNSLGTAPVTDPAGATSGASRLRRGGSWWHDAQSCRSAFRYYYTSSFSYRDFGLRIVVLPEL